MSNPPCEECNKYLLPLVAIVLHNAPRITCAERTHGETGTEPCGRLATHVVEWYGGPRLGGEIMPVCARCMKYYRGERREITDADRLEIMAAEMAAGA